MEYKISIPEPCGENWTKMTSSEQGRFCSGCQTEVIDFTTKTDLELLAFIQAGGKGCGRFRKEQLTQTYLAPKPPRFWHRYFRIGVALGLSFLSFAGFAQAPKDTMVVEQKHRSTPIQQVAENNQDTIPTTDVAKFSGMVVDENGTPMAFANVSWSIDGVIYGETTDLDGLFSLDLNGKEVAPTMAVTVSSLGYKVKEQTLRLNADNLIVLPENNNIIGMIIFNKDNPYKPQEQGTKFKQKHGVFRRD